jgi:ATP-dependent DNA ligase
VTARRCVIRSYPIPHNAWVFLYAFDLIELNGTDLRRDPLVVRKATLASILAKAAVGIRVNEHMEFDDGEVVFYHACHALLSANRILA